MASCRRKIAFLFSSWVELLRKMWRYSYAVSLPGLRSHGSPSIFHGFPIDFSWISYRWESIFHRWESILIDVIYGKSIFLKIWELTSYTKKRSETIIKRLEAWMFGWNEGGNHGKSQCLIFIVAQFILSYKEHFFDQVVGRCWISR